MKNIKDLQDRITYFTYRKVVLNEKINESLDIIQNGGPLMAFTAEKRLETQYELLDEVLKELKSLRALEKRSYKKV